MKVGSLEFPRTEPVDTTKSRIVVYLFKIIGRQNLSPTKRYTRGNDRYLTYVFYIRFTKLVIPRVDFVVFMYVDLKLVGTIILLYRSNNAIQ